MRICAASSWFSSTLILTSRTAPLAAATAFSSAGPSCLHGPHQGAQKTTTIAAWEEDSMTSALELSVEPSLIRPAAPLAGDWPKAGPFGALAPLPMMASMVETPYPRDPLVNGGSERQWQAAWRPVAGSGLLGQCQGITSVGGETLGLGQAQLLAHEVGAQDHRHHLVDRVAAAHAFPPHAAIGRDPQPLRRHVLQRRADDLRHLVGTLDLKRVVVDDADDNLLVLDDFADGLQIAGARGAGLEGEGVGIDLGERLERRLVALHLLEYPLLRGVAPTGVTPDLGLGAQAVDRAVEDVHQLLGAELAEGGAARWHHVDLRLFHLDHRAAGIGQLVQFGVERRGQRHGALDRVLVMRVGQAHRQQFGRDGAELDRLFGETLRPPPHRRVLQIAA